MNSSELKELYLSFFEKKGHKRIESASLIPENDPTVLFTTAGMHPLVPFLMGEPHPLGKRICNVQKCIRTGDIDEVGDASHLTFFEMLGNWSFGDYFKEDSIKYSWEFLTKELKLEKERLAVTCFKGDENASKDTVSYEIWKSLGLKDEKIKFLGKKDNWWGPAGETGPCGPDTEMFYYVGKNVPDEFDENDSNWFEIWNNVFMEYNKTKNGYESLKQKNVDTGFGVERVSTILQNKNSVYESKSFAPIIQEIKKHSNNINEQSLRIIADHLRASIFILADHRTVTPSNVDQGYILRRFIRRSIRHLNKLGAKDSLLKIANVIINQFKNDYPELEEKKDFILDELNKEKNKFETTLEKGLRAFEKYKNNISGKEAFLLFQSYGFPIEITQELAKEKNITVNLKEFDAEFKKHQELSRIGAEKKFKGGLADSSEMSKKLHTATHLLNEALREILGDTVKQKGSNINPERLRFDFNFDRKLTPEEKKQIEDLINKKISEAIPIKREEMPLTKAKEIGAQAEFGAKYPEIVSVYFIGDFSKEICGGPHVENTKELGKFKIKKEESSAAGVRRIKAILE